MDNNSIKKNIGYRLSTLFIDSGAKQKDLAEFINVKPNIISYFVNGDRVPNTEQVVKIAQFFNISADYLLGISDIKTADTNVKAIRDYTGLSEDAIYALNTRHSIEAPKEHYYLSDSITIINSFIENEKTIGFFNEFGEYCFSDMATFLKSIDEFNSIENSAESFEKYVNNENNFTKLLGVLQLGRIKIYNGNKDLEKIFLLNLLDNLKHQKDSYLKKWKERTAKYRDLEQ